MNDRIKKIISSLLAKARSTDNEHEAEAFLAKAMEMMQQYQLDISNMVDEGDPILNHTGVKGAASGHAWRWIAVSCSRTSLRVQRHLCGRRVYDRQ